MTRHAALVVVCLFVAAVMAAATVHKPPEARTTAVVAAPIDASRTFVPRASRSGYRDIEPATTTTAPPTTTTTAAPTPKRAVTVQKTPAARHAAPAVVSASSGGLPAGLICIRNQESGGNYADNTGNNFYGAYQYLNSTWAGYGGYARADLAPPNIQDERALSDYNRGAASRHNEWPRASRLCGV